MKQGIKQPKGHATLSPTGNGKRGEIYEIAGI